MTVGLAVLLGAVQGLTEFIPISSKTHLVVVPALIGERPPSLAFITLLHLGTLVALLAYFARDLVRIASEVARPGSEGRRLAGLIALATVPAVIVGLAFEETFERLLTRPRGAAISLLATAALLVGAEWAAGTIGPRSRLARPLRSAVSLRDGVSIGVAQTVAFLPGVSRSGITMGTGLALGLRREAAARFSFLLAIPALAGANVLELPQVVGDGIGAPEVAGFAASLGFGYASVSVLIRYLRRYSFLPFAAYCAVFAVATWAFGGLGN